MNKMFSDDMCPILGKSYLKISDESKKFVQDFLADNKFAKFVFKIIRREITVDYNLYELACKSWHECLPFIASELNHVWASRLKKIQYAARISMQMSIDEICEKKLIGVFFFEFGRSFPDLHLVRLF